jgi:rRNA maturation endonuclease Nob1
MPPNFTEKPCPQCGRTVRSTDRFCIFCGGKLQAPEPPKPIPQPAPKAEPPKPVLPKEEEKQIEQEVNNDLASILQSKKGDQELDKKSRPFVPKSTADTLTDLTDLDDHLELTDDVKAQIEAKIELALLDEKKKKLKAKIEEIAKLAEDERYDWDYDYKKDVNNKLEAVKSIRDEFVQEEEKWRAVLKDRFPLDKYDDTMDEKRLQLIELRRQFKLHQLKKDIYDQLKQEYTSQFREAEKQSKELRQELLRWFSRQQSELNRLDGRLKVLKARLKTKEMNQEDYDKQKEELDKDRERIRISMTILDNYAHEKPKKFL